MRKVYPSMQIACPKCDTQETIRHGALASVLPDDFTPRTADQIDWADDGFGRCPDCGAKLNASVGGWRRKLRWKCLGCGDPLNGRQVKWCSRSGFGWAKVCSVAWDNPTLLAGGLRKRQQNLCGVCIRPMDTWDVEVDHVVPLAADGARTLDNLRTTHRECNQLKKARPLAETRIIHHDLTDTEVLRRLAGAEPETVELLKGPPLDVLRLKLRPFDRPWPAVEEMTGRLF